MSWWSTVPDSKTGATYTPPANTTSTGKTIKSVSSGGSSSSSNNTTFKGSAEDFEALYPSTIKKPVKDETVSIMPIESTPIKKAIKTVHAYGDVTGGLDLFGSGSFDGAGAGGSFAGSPLAKPNVYNNIDTFLGGYLPGGNSPQDVTLLQLNEKKDFLTQKADIQPSIYEQQLLLAQQKADYTTEYELIKKQIDLAKYDWWEFMQKNDVAMNEQRSNLQADLTRQQNENTQLVRQFEQSQQEKETVQMLIKQGATDSEITRLKENISDLSNKAIATGETKSLFNIGATGISSAVAVGGAFLLGLFLIKK